MKYDFTSILDRKGKDAFSVDMIGFGRFGCPTAPKEGFDPIPMWLADMNFPVVHTIVDAIIERAKHPCFGYFTGSEEYYNSIISWHEKRYGVTGMKREHIQYENGVLGALATIMNVLGLRGDKVLLHSPTYKGFTHTLEDNGYQIVLSPLYLDENNIWRMDFEDMERKIVENQVHATVFCSPHNPCGRVWEQWELEKAMEIFKKHDVYVISDEIWADLVRPEQKHIPTQMVSEDAKQRTIAIYGTAKTFNLAGMIGAYRIVYNDLLQQRISRAAGLTHYNEQNVLSMHALIGAYKPEGHEWVDELNQVLAGNVDFAVDYINEHFEGVEVSKPQGTYMLFVDCTKWCEKHGKTIEEVKQAGWDVGVAWQDGREFHGPCHMRMNLALPLSRVQEAFKRLDEHVFNAKW